MAVVQPFIIKKNVIEGTSNTQSTVGRGTSPSRPMNFIRGPSPLQPSYGRGQMMAILKEMAQEKARTVEETHN